MSKNYGENAPLSYNKYLRVQDLINLQDCLSSPAHHDELLFITVHQAYELWFKQILHELDAAISLLEEDRVPAAARAVKRIVEIEKLLVNQIHILESMSPISFLAFRDQLNPASGFQSMQFREIELSSGLKDKNMVREFSSDEFAYERLQKRLAGPSLAESFFHVLQRRGLKAPLSSPDDDATQQKKAYGERTQAVSRFSRTSKNAMKSFNSPRRCSNTMNTSRSGVRIT